MLDENTTEKLMNFKHRTKESLKETICFSEDKDFLDLPDSKSECQFYFVICKLKA